MRQRVHLLIEREISRGAAPDGAGIGRAQRAHLSLLRPPTTALTFSLPVGACAAGATLPMSPRALWARACGDRASLVRRRVNNSPKGKRAHHPCCFASPCSAHHHTCACCPAAPCPRARRSPRSPRGASLRGAWPSCFLCAPSRLKSEEWGDAVRVSLARLWARWARPQRARALSADRLIARVRRLRSSRERGESWGVWCSCCCCALIL